MSKVLVVFTGGTIGARYFPNGIDIEEKGAYPLLIKFENCGFDFEVVEPINILSENLLPQDWTKIIREIRKFNLVSELVKVSD